MKIEVAETRFITNEQGLPNHYRIYIRHNGAYHRIEGEFTETCAADLLNALRGMGCRPREEVEEWYEFPEREEDRRGEPSNPRQY